MAIANDKPELALGRVLDFQFRGTNRPLLATADNRRTVVESGPSAADAAAAYLLVPRREVVLTSIEDPANPLRGYFLGRAGTPNQICEGIAAEAIDSWAVDPKGARYAAARERLTRFLRWQLEVGLMSVPGGARRQGGPLSEGVSVSHSQWWLNGFAAARWHARHSRDPELLARTGDLWHQLLSLARISKTGNGHWLVAGPRANRRPEGGAVKDPSAQGRNAVLDDLAALVFDHQEHAATGIDLLSLRIVAALLREGDALAPPAKPLGQTTPEDLPRIVDRLVIGRRPGEVAVWVAGKARNNTIDPGYQEFARAYGDGREAFGVDPRAALPPTLIAVEPGQTPPPHPALERWNPGWRTRPAGRRPFPPSWEGVEEAGGGHPQPTFADLPPVLQRRVEAGLPLETAIALARKNRPEFAARWPE